MCVPRYALLQWRAPAPGSTFTPGSPVPLEAALLVAAGRARNDPPSLPFEASGDGGTVTGLLSRVDAGLFSTSTAFGAGTWSATVRYPDAGLVDGPLVFTVRSADFVVSWPPPPARLGPPGVQAADPLDDGTFFRRDEQTELVVKNAAGATGVSVTVLGIGVDGGAPELVLVSTSCAACAGEPGFCACYPLDLATPGFDAFRARLGFRVSGQVDGQLVTQSSATHPLRIPTLPVTRWKWALAGPADAGPASLSGPVLDPAGNVIASFMQLDAGSLDFGVASISPTGLTNWVSRVGNATTDLGLSLRDAGAPQVVFGSQTRGFVSLSTGDGSGGVVCTPPTGGLITGGLTMLEGGLLGVDVPVSFSFVPPSTNALAFAAPFSTSMCLMQSVPGSGVISANATTVHFATNSPAQLYAVNVFGSTTSQPPPMGVTAVTQLIPQPMNGLLGAGASAFTVAPTSVQPGAARGTGAQSTSAFWLPIDDPSGLVLSRFPLSGTLSTPTAPTLGLEGASGTVSFGAGGVAYASTSAGFLVAVGANGARWSTPPDARLPGFFTSTLLLDCARNVGGAKLAGRPGVAYLVGAPLRVQAIVIDSPGLDVTQPWPMHRHDPRGTNNAATSLAEFACP